MHNRSYERLESKSHPSRVRGLKQRLGPPPRFPNAVAPITGAWIETHVKDWGSHFPQVAPITGAWIETRPPILIRFATTVAPITGAWIETITSGR